ncbi:MAG: glycine cleavage system protein GcvH [Pirellulales bacterium]|nr:glycine cleavage system protein GcvH [Pirellulales bacterium]
MNPEELLYAKTHEWVHVAADDAGSKIVTVGLSSFALEALTDLVFLDLPDVGREVRAAEPFGEVESVKAVSDLYSPVNGEIVDVNQKLVDNLENLPKDPYGIGWLAKIKVTDESGLANLMDYPTYKKQCEEEA